MVGHTKEKQNVSILINTYYDRLLGNAYFIHQFIFDCEAVIAQELTQVNQLIAVFQGSLKLHNRHSHQEIFQYTFFPLSPIIISNVFMRVLSFCFDLFLYVNMLKRFRWLSVFCQRTSKRTLRNGTFYVSISYELM